MFEDEAQFGVCPEVGSQTIREYVYVFAAASPLDGHHDSLVMPCANTEAMTIFGEEVGRGHADEHIIMFMDQAGIGRRPCEYLGI